MNRRLAPWILLALVLLVPGRAGAAPADGAGLIAALTRTDGTTSPVTAVWMAPEAVEYAVAADGKSDASDSHITLRFLSSVLMFLVVPPEGKDGKPDGLATLAERIVLRDKQGRTFKPVAVPQQMAEGLAGDKERAALAFSAQDAQGKPITGTGRLQLVVSGVGEEAERVLTWDLPLAFDQSALAALRALRAKRLALAKATPVKADALIADSVLWFSEFLMVDGKWFMVSWLPREILVPGTIAFTGKDRQAAAVIRQALSGITCAALSTMDKEVTTEDLKQVAARIRFVTAAGKQFADTPSDNALIKTLSESVAGASGEGSTRTVLLVFPTPTSFTTSPPVRLAVLDPAGATMSTIPWKKPTALPDAFSKLLAPAAPSSVRRPVRKR